MFLLITMMLTTMMVAAVLVAVLPTVMPIYYFSGATLVWVNLYVRSFEKIDDVKV